MEFKLLHKRKVKLSIFILVLMFVVMACSLDSCSGDDEPDSTQTATYPALATSTPLSDDGQETPDPSDFPTLTPTSAAPTEGSPSTSATGAACLPGTWQIDHQSIQNYMTLTMIGVGEYGFNPISSEGKLELQISPGQVILLAENLKIKVGVSPGGVGSVTNSDAIIQSNGSAAYTASDTNILLSAVTYNAVGILESPTAAFSVDFTDLISIARDYGFYRTMENIIKTSASMIYTCAGDTLTIVVNSYASVSFWRVLP